MKTTLERTPSELARAIADRGIVSAGGGALMKNLDTLLRKETGLPLFLAEDPISVVVTDAGKALESSNDSGLTGAVSGLALRRSAVRMRFS